ncbi:hypothetical protein KHQ81_04725 [Mycoplasmatota bacterium]|nr:hypothetical protein KHQ81_04725 [Mycoplasmatota bacterium]
MDPILIGLLLMFILFIPFTIKQHKESIKREILIAENKVKEFISANGYEITEIQTKQKEIKVKGIHLGALIKAFVIDSEGLEHEIILNYNPLKNKTKVISDKLL